MRKIFKEIWCAGTAYDPMNESFKSIRWHQRFYLIMWIFGFAGFFKALEMNNTKLALLSLILIIIGEGSFLHWSLAEVRRELWFVEHKLGLPKIPEELEDIEAYNKWLEEYLRRGGASSEKDQRLF